MKDTLVEAVREALGESDCVVALGGGADSAVLLWAVVEAVGAGRVRGVFVFHGLEGSEILRSAAEALTAKLGVELRVLDRVIPEGGNLEARAREARYEAIELLREDGVICLTGHTSDDQAETVLMRLLRGSGTGAIAGIPYSRGVWRRPILHLSREKIRGVANDLELPFADDPANEDERFLRARIRHKILPLLESEFGDDVKSALCRSSLLLSADDEVLEDAASSVPIEMFRGCVSIHAPELVALPVPVGSRVIRRALRLLSGGVPGSMSDIEAVLRTAAGGESVSISGGLQVVFEPPTVTIFDPAKRRKPDGFHVRIGETFEWEGVTYSVSEGVHSQVDIPIGGSALSADVLSSDLSVRGFLPGDRLEIEVGSTPVKELLRAEGVPPRARQASLLVIVDDEIAAIVGVRVATWAKPKEGEAAVIIKRGDRT